MAADFDKPTKDSTYLNYSDEILALAEALGKMDHAASANPPTGLIQLKPGDLDRFQRYNGATYDPVLLKQVDTDEDSYAGFSADDVYKINIAGQDILVIDAAKLAQINDPDGDSFAGFTADDTYKINIGGADFLIFDTTGIALASTVVKDENDMASDSDKHLATQQSIKKFVEDSVPGYSASYIETLGLNDGTYDIALPTEPSGDLADAVFMTGIASTIIWMYLNVAPPGWKVLATGAGNALAVSGGSDAYNANGGTEAGTWTQPTHIHTMPTHNHKWYDGCGANCHGYTYTAAGGSQIFQNVANSVGGYQSLVTHNNAYANCANFDAWTAKVDPGDAVGNRTATTWRPLASIGRLFQLDTA